jgi:hypothetical protein
MNFIISKLVFINLLKKDKLTTNGKTFLAAPVRDVGKVVGPRPHSTVGVVPALFNVSNAGVNMLLLGWAYE